jgi:hypothetical protein
LVVWGGKDRILPASTGQALASEIPDARLAVLDGVGHCPMIEVPVEFCRLLAEFTHDPQNGRPVTALGDMTGRTAKSSRGRWRQWGRSRPAQDVS